MNQTPATSATQEAAGLPRLRTDLGPESVLPDGPPVPPRVGDMDLRPVDPDSNDPERISAWMRKPHLADTWEQPWPPGRWRADAIARLGGTYSVPCILSYGGRDIGYVEIYRAHRDEVGAVYPSTPHDLGVHIAIGEESLTGKGVFPSFFRDLIEALFDADPFCDTIVADPDHRNARIHRALAKAGVTGGTIIEVRPDRTIRLSAVHRADWSPGR
ncbi:MULTISPECIES: GNAT family N-acetyltransferase [Corynebacterium]|uniref:Lysine N-acyltransferase MbtK n=1 Tax=Corynebacterium freneyi TaxID=134034 RepID=A0ABS4UAM3_9CORY|nr:MULTISPECIES: GNAT family N-acetyltransferase [Corynebacterium]MBP2333565.1 RimJ/RimL family protein N-acetyltransferase [Corynebacterium freneyi]MCG7438409.1 acetyltransferase [Corynebacterium freneyi]OFU52625.1 hypothetical protein HMPREF3121_10470 [Corynebacterium sp. HMSC11E11]QXA52412.1 acetyltransferase [Corynebacterium freneyi]UBI02697.1 acetyltransferase [Corynebacterium freneyi]